MMASIICNYILNNTAAWSLANADILKPIIKINGDCDAIIIFHQKLRYPKATIVSCIFCHKLKRRSCVFLKVCLKKWSLFDAVQCVFLMSIVPLFMFGLLTIWKMNWVNKLGLLVSNNIICVVEMTRYWNLIEATTGVTSYGKKDFKKCLIFSPKWQNSSSLNKC